MESRKHSHLELVHPTINNKFNNKANQKTASGTTPNGIFFIDTKNAKSGMSSSLLPSNILAVCDNNSDNSREYSTDNPILTKIKQEESEDVTLITYNQTQHQPYNLITSDEFKQYIVDSSVTPIKQKKTANSMLISNNESLSADYDMFVIQEVIDTPKLVVTNSSSLKDLGMNTTIKEGPISPPIQCKSTSLNAARTHFKLKSMSPSSSLPISSTGSRLKSKSAIQRNITVPVSSNSLTTFPDVLEHYSNVDDRRRATNKEAERKRRDKINSWMFKLKEMLPLETTPRCDSTISNKKVSRRRLLLKQAGNKRATSTGSKTQVLIKACEYIKSMQEEIKSMRECLIENENLRLSNQRLQNEINSLRSKQQCNHRDNNLDIKVFIPKQENND